MANEAWSSSIPTKPRWKNTSANIESEVLPLRARPPHARPAGSRTKDGTEITLMGNIEFPHEVENALAKGVPASASIAQISLPRGGSRAQRDRSLQRLRRGDQVARRPARSSIHSILARQIRSLARTRSRRTTPSSGCRSIRLCLANLDMFQVQLRATLRARRPLGDMRVACSR